MGYVTAQMNVAIDYGTFYNPEKGPYVETYILIPASSITYKEVEGGEQASAQITLMFKEGEEVKAFDKFLLNSEVIEDAENGALNMVDLKRLFVPNGKYTFSIDIADMANPENKASVSFPLEISKSESNVTVSDLLLIEKISTSESENIYTRGDYDMVPNVIRFYPESMNSLKYYAEVYQSEKLGDAFLAKAYISENGKAIPDLQKMTKVSAGYVAVVYDAMDISKLPNGNYDLVLEIRDKKNELIASSIGPFQRSNPSLSPVSSITLKDVNPENSFLSKYDDKQITEYLKYLDPVITEDDRVMIEASLKAKDGDRQRRILLNYWMAQEELDPESAFNEYMTLVRLVNDQYATQLEPGYQTDRGYFILRYGKPNDILPINNEAGAVPYEIWTYNSVERTHQTNVKTVFYNPDYIVNDYEIIHSEIRGEFNNRRWQLDVVNAFKNSNSAEDFDSEDLRDSFGKQLDDNFGE